MFTSLPATSGQRIRERVFSLSNDEWHHNTWIVLQQLPHAGAARPHEQVECGASSQVWSASTRAPCEQVMGPESSATVKTDAPSDGQLRAQADNTSQGPIQSSPATLGNRAMAMLGPGMKWRLA